MRIYIGTDHAGFELKEKLKIFLSALGHTVEDMGAHAYNNDDDYPDFVHPVTEAVVRDPGSRGIVIGGSGQGEAMCANRVRGARAAVYYGGPVDIVVLSREHNDANILSLGARFIEEDEAEEVVRLWLETPFGNAERNTRRIKSIDDKEYDD